MNRRREKLKRDGKRKEREQAFKEKMTQLQDNVKLKELCTL